jgi:oxygen-dependent protoporphyrinogen oxidase
VERRRLLGILWPSSLFPKRAPEGAVLTTSFVGGARMPGLARLDDSELLALVRAEHEALLGARGAPLLARITRWERGIPQYVAGHERITSALEEFEQRRRGLFLLGNYRGGVSVEKCWRNGAALAARIAERKQIRQTAT